MTKQEDKHLFDTFKISKVQCHFGGERYFVHCPTCERRYAKLYIHNKLLACRSATIWRIGAKTKKKAWRFREKYRAIEKRLLNDVYAKPKWMRKKTFDVYKGEYLDLKEKEEMAEFLVSGTTTLLIECLRSMKALNGRLRSFLFKEFPF